ncbi:hypothetical protein AVEN_168897-1 [Araneus ventricosus]|uniref:Uncharacterized protein n=1 Tax=Araneus ventricosus TaxID=182803 RepID=A0A4Y2TFS4_ARAVE|nr:hypothetical protein AVEN_168897-1 [Araneus ventricosus]
MRNRPSLGLGFGAGGFQVRYPIPLKIHCVWGLLHAKSYVMAKRSPTGVAWKLGERVPIQVSSSSSDPGSKLRGEALELLRNGTFKLNLNRNIQICATNLNSKLKKTINFHLLQERTKFKKMINFHLLQKRTTFQKMINFHLLQKRTKFQKMINFHLLQKRTKFQKMINFHLLQK